MRIMQLYRIESEYKNHLKRLDNIKKTNSKDKIQKVTSQQFFLSNERKKLRHHVENFKEKQQNQRILHNQTLMQKTITDRSKRIRLQYQATLNVINSQQKIKNLNNSEVEKIETENLILKSKIQKAKSVYKEYRRNSQIELVNGRGESIKQKQREKLLKLLKSQFKLQPTVVFPKSKSKTICLEDIQDEIYKEQFQS